MLMVRPRGLHRALESIEESEESPESTRRRAIVTSCMLWWRSLVADSIVDRRLGQTGLASAVDGKLACRREKMSLSQVKVETRLVPVAMGTGSGQTGGVSSDRKQLAKKSALSTEMFEMRFSQTMGRKESSAVSAEIRGWTLPETRRSGVQIRIASTGTFEKRSLLSAVPAETRLRRYSTRRLSPSVERVDLLRGRVGTASTGTELVMGEIKSSPPSFSVLSL